MEMFTQNKTEVQIKFENAIMQIIMFNHHLY